MKRHGGKLMLKVDPRSGGMAQALRAAAEASPLLVVTGRALTDLADELGSMEAAAEYLHEAAMATNKPIAVNLPTGPDTSSTAFVAPRSWSAERLAGWVAGHHQELEGEFGQVSRIGLDWPEGNRR